MRPRSFYVGIVGNIISVCMFLSPVKTFYRIIKHRSTEEFESLPYICTLLNASLWTYYGILKEGELLVATINGFGVFVETIYVTLFFIYAPRRLKAKIAVHVGILDVGFLAAAILVSRLVFQGEARLYAIGFMGALVNIIMYASPLAAVRTVVRTKSVEYMPFFLTLLLFLNGGTWAIYAKLLHDYLLLVPNGVGVLLGALQMLLYMIYKDANPSVSDSMETGLQHENLIPSSNESQESSEE